ncbi:MAG: DMT family transporter, partial [Lachnospiraceae bacterium]|nr:DMT family transporter [Lachnospiraceae bacterium]
ALFANFFLQNEKINHSFVLGFLVSMIGIIVVELNGNFILKLNPFGDLLAILSAIMWGIYCIFINKINEKGYPILLTIRRIFFYGLVTTIPIIILTKTKISVQKIWHPGYLIGLLFLGVLASAFCYAIWNKVTTILGVVKTNAYLYALPVITIILSTIIWKEKLTPFMVVGSLLTIAGLFLSEKKEQTHIEEHEAKELESV